MRRIVPAAVAALLLPGLGLGLLEAVPDGDPEAAPARAAAAGLPTEMPAFFREADEGLAYLNPEPDRWRNRALGAMDQAWSYDHYVDLENLPDGALDRVYLATCDESRDSPGLRERVEMGGNTRVLLIGAPNRFVFLRQLYEAGLEVPERDAGFLPYRILELYQRLVTEWRLWREAGPEERRWIEMRIVNDAGILGHYVTDASHTTIHFNGWNRDAPNPRGFTYADDFHWRFESRFVDAHVRQGDVDRYATPGVRSVAGGARAAIWDLVLESHGQVERLYELEQAHGFDPDADDAPAELQAFTARRLAAGADMLRTLWWSAWLESAAPADGG